MYLLSIKKKKYLISVMVHSTYELFMTSSVHLSFGFSENQPKCSYSIENVLLFKAI